MLVSGLQSDFAGPDGAIEIVQYHCPACGSTDVAVLPEPLGGSGVTDGGTRIHYNHERMQCRLCGVRGEGESFFWRSEAVTTREAFAAVCAAWEADEEPLRDLSHRWTRLGEKRPRQPGDWFGDDD